MARALNARARATAPEPRNGRAPLLFIFHPPHSPRQSVWGRSGDRGIPVRAAPPTPINRTSTALAELNDASMPPAAVPAATPKYSVLLPTYNERENIGLIVWLLVQTFEEQLSFGKERGVGVVGRALVCFFPSFRRSLTLFSSLPLSIQCPAL